MTTTKNNEHKKLNFSSEREQSQACLNSAEHEKNQGRKVLNVPNKQEQNQTCLDSAEREGLRPKGNVPNLRFPEFQGKWDKCKFRDVCSISTGNKNTQDKIDDGIYPFYVRSQTVERINSWTFDGEAILTAGDGVGVGKVFHHTYGKIGVHQRVYILSDFKCDANYLFHFFSSKFYNRVKRMSAKNSVDSVRKEMITDMPLSLPSHQEQVKIGYLLSLLDERIATQSKIIDKLQSLIKGISSRIFASIQGIEYRMGDIVTITNGNSNVQDAVTQSKDGLYPFFDRSEDIKYLPTFLFDKEAIIYPGEGTEFMPRYFKGKFALHQRCYAIFDFNEIINARFLYFYLKTRNSYFVKNAVGSTVPSLRLDTFQKLKVIIPPKKIQHSVSLCLSSMEQKCNVEKKILHKRLKQKQYLLRQMFI